VDEQGHTITDGKITQQDRWALADALKRLKVDITGDGQMDQADVDKAKDIAALMAYYNVSISAIENADVNNDGQYTEEDIILFNKALKIVNDVNGDGRMDISDVNKVREVVDYMTLRQVYGTETLTQADVNGDGLVSEEEKKELLAVMHYYVDVTGDGVVDEEDIEELEDVLTYLRLDVSTDEFNRADLDLSGEVDAGDLDEISHAVNMFSKCDIDGDGAVTVADRNVVDDIAKFMELEEAELLGYDIEAIQEADVNDDGKVDSGDIALMDYYLSAKFDLGGTEGIWDLEDVNIMEKIVEYFDRRVDSQIRLYADIDNDGLITQNDINSLSGYLQDISRGDFKGNGPVMSVIYGSITEGQQTIDLTEENSTVSDVVGGIYTTTVTSQTPEGEDLVVKITIEASTKNIVRVQVDGDYTDAAGDNISDLGNGNIMVTINDDAVLVACRDADGVIDQYDMAKVQKIIDFTNYDFTYRVETDVDDTPVTGNAEWFFNNGTDDTEGLTLVVTYKDGSRDEIKQDAGENIIELKVVDRYSTATTLVLNSSNSNVIEEGIEIPDIAGQKVIIVINASNDITKVVRVQNIDYEFEEITTGYKTGDDGELLLDSNGQPIPDFNISATHRITGSVVMRSDINGDGFVTVEDKQIIEDVLIAALDVNGDGDISQLDFDNIAAVIESIEMNLTEEDIQKADIDFDGDIDADDIELFEEAFSIFTRADVDGVAGATQADIEFIKGIFQFAAESDIIMPRAEIEMADINGDGTVNASDQALLLDVLEYLQDLNHDGMVDSNDADRLLEILQAFAMDIGPEDLVRADVNEDGLVDQVDIDLLLECQVTYELPYLDVNQDGEKDEADIDELLRIYNGMLEQGQINLEEFAQYDVTGDGVIDDLDIEKMLTVLRYHVDVNGDGIIDQDDITFIEKVIEYQATGITEYERLIADLNGDGRVTPDDEYRLSQLVAVFKNGDINADGIIDWGDLDELVYILAFLENVQTYLPEVVDKADMNRDGVVDRKDLNYLEMLTTHSVDIDGNGRVDGTDVALIYDIIDALKHGMDRVDELGIELTQDASAMIAQAIEVFATTDINGDGVVNYHDIELFVEIILLMDLEGAVYDHELEASDVNGDGVVDEQDINIVESVIGTFTIVKKGSQAAINDGLFGYTILGDTIYARERGSYVKYVVGDFSTLPCNYDLEIDVRSYNYQQLPSPEYKYEFEVYVDNAFIGEVEVQAHRDTYQTGTLNLDLSEGGHEVQLVWTNALTDNSSSMQIGEFRLVNTRDVDHSGTVSPLDRQAISDAYEGRLKIDLDGSGRIDIYDKEFLQERIALYDTNEDGQLFRGEGGILDAEFDALNMSHVLAPDGQASDELIDQGDVDIEERIIISIYQVDRLKQSDIAGRNPDGSIDYQPDGLITSADVEASEKLLSEYVDINNDGVVDDADEDYIQNIIDFNRYAVSESERFSADLSKDSVIDDQDRIMLDKNLKLYEELDINGDGVVNDADLDEIVAIFKVFEINEDILDTADIDGDNIVDVNDRTILSRALKYSIDINEDGKWDTDDINIMQSIVDTNVQRVSGSLDPIYIAMLDISGPEGEADGFVDDYDLDLLTDSINNRIDVNSDGKVDIIDLHITSLEVDLYQYEQALFGKYTTVANENIAEIIEIVSSYDVNEDDMISASDIQIILDIAEFVEASDLSMGAISEQDILEAIAALPALQPSIDSMQCAVTIEEDLTEGDSKVWSYITGAWTTTEENALWQEDTRVYGYAKTGYARSWEDVNFTSFIKFDSYNKKAGVILRAQEDFANCYRVELTDEAIVFSIIEEDVVTSQELVPVGQEIRKDTWYKLEVKNTGNLFEIYLDGSLKMSVYDTDNKFPAGDVYLYTDHCVTGFKDIKVETVTDLEYIRQKEILDADLTGDGEITAADYSTLISLVALSTTDIDGNTVATEDDKVKLMHISNILRFTDPADITSASSILDSEIIGTYDITGDNVVDVLDINEAERMKEFTDVVQRKTSQNLEDLDIVDDDGVNLNDRLWVIQRFERYLDINSDGIVDTRDLQRIESLAKAQLLIRSVWPTIQDNTQLQQEVKYVVDYDGNGIIDQKDVELLQIVVDNFSNADVNGDTLTNADDIARLDSILTMLYKVKQLNPSEIVKVDLVGKYNPITDEYARPDGIIDENDLEKSMEILNGLYAAGPDGIIDPDEAGGVWSDLSSLFRVGVESETLDDADLNSDGKIDADDVTMFINKSGIYLRTDIDGDGFVDDRDLDAMMTFIQDVYQRIQ
ncbi:MAG: dockerin type I domain-containing protein, partial [Candidatus Omnitrophota bacterium]